MNELSTSLHPDTTPGQSTIEIPDQPHADPGERVIHHDEIHGRPPPVDDGGAPEADRQPKEAMAVPVVRRRRGRGLLLAGVAVVLVGGATAAGVMYHQPLMTHFDKLRAEALSQMPKYPKPVHPAERLGQTGESSELSPPHPSAGQTGSEKSSQNSQHPAATPPAERAETGKPAAVGISGSASNPTKLRAPHLAGSGSESALAQFESLQTGAADTGTLSEAGAGKGGTASPSGKTAAQAKPNARKDLPAGFTNSGHATTSSGQAKAGAGPGAAAGARIGMPANTLKPIQHPVQAAIGLDHRAANGSDPSLLYVMSLAGKLGLVVDEERTEVAHLDAEVAAMRQEMKDQLASFNRRLTYEQAKARLALAGSANPHLPAAATPPTGIFPQHRLPRAEPVSPSSYRVQAASPGLAILSRDGDAYEVSVGNIVPGVGRVLSIQQEGSLWVVQTTHGVIR